MTEAAIDNHLEVTEGLPTPARSYGASIMHMVRDPAIPTETKQMLLQMWKDSFAEQAREQYQAAYVAFQAEMPPVERDGMVDLGPGKGRYPFTTYEQMDKILRPMLTKHGLALQFWSSAPESKDVIIVHGSLFGHGHHQDSTYPVPPDTGPGRNALQARGSAQTYAKRYIADLLCNIVRKGKDNDGRGAIDLAIDATQVKTLADLLKATATDEAAFLKLMVTGADALPDVRQRDYARLLLGLQEKARRKRI